MEAISWKSAFSSYQYYLQMERGMSDHTLLAYQRDLERYRLYAEALQQINSPAGIAPETLRTFLTWLVEDCLLSHRSLARNISALRSFHGFLFHEGLVAENPASLLEMPRFAQKLPFVLSVEEMQHLLTALPTRKDHHLRNKAMLEVLYAAGLRVSELISLELSNLHLEEGFLRVWGKGAKERLVPIGQPAIDALQEYLQTVRIKQKPVKDHDHFVFLSKLGKSLSRVMVFHIVKAVAKRADLPPAVSPHTFRHSFATHLIEGGADLRAVQEMLGHESITTTELYLHMDRSYLREIMAMYHPRS